MYQVLSWIQALNEGEDDVLQSPDLHKAEIWVYLWNLAHIQATVDGDI